MTESINWIHLTDIHLGLDEHLWLWPKIKYDLLRDIEKLGGDIGGWDLVFFTGDFSQRAAKKEFDHLNKELEELWKIFTKSGNTPFLCAVPGNHDLIRPDKEAAITRALTQLWWSDSGLRQQFWQDQNCEYRTAINEYFANYTEWISSLPVPQIERVEGMLPGDFSGTLSKGKIKLGIIGLNSAFLQIADGDFNGKLDMHVAQLNSVCIGETPRWLKDRTASVLLTHHPPSWLAPEGLDHFRQEVYPAGRFLAQLCGHQHEPETFEMSEAGAPPRRLRQGPSVFGLEYWGSDRSMRRHHGYTAGQFVFEGSGGFEKRWPRTSVKGRHGGLNICPDHTYKLQEGDCVVTHFDLDVDEGGHIHTDSEDASNLTMVASEISPALPKVDLQLLEGLLDEKTAKERLAACQRLSLNLGGSQSRYVRLLEQSEFENELRKSRCIWLTADWGTGAEGFLASSFARFCTKELSPEIFHLRCDDASDVDRLEALFSQQFGMPLQAFCALVAKLKGSFLVIDGIHPELCGGEQLEKLIRMANAIIDYCPELHLVFVSRLKPESWQLSIVELRPLDVPDVRTYLTHHPEATPDLQEPEVVEKLHEHSDGLPMHLDRILKALKVSSLASVLETNMEGPSVTVGIPEQTSKALAHAVTIIAKSDDKRNKRSFRLLKVLSVLPYGETLEALSHYLPTEPFFYENALQLKELALLDVIPLQHAAPNIGIGNIRIDEQSAPKILKVPRQVRDYVQTLLSEKEREEIVLAGIDKFFGRGWRDGKVKLRKLSLEYREYLTSGAGNEFALIHHLITQGRNNGDERTIRSGALLGIEYAQHLERDDRYRDLATVAGALVQIVDSNEFPEDWSKLSALFGKGLRMTGKREEAAKYLKASLDVEDVCLSNDEKASIWLNIALVEGKNKSEKAAVAAAEEVRKYVKLGSAKDLQAMSIIAEFTLSGSDKRKRLSEFEKEARNKGYTTVADNIAIDLAYDAETPSEEIRQLDKVLASKERGYNQVRALVTKARAVQQMGEIATLNTNEVFALSAAYSYLHAQRFGSLFDSCHEVLWQIYESKSNTPQLLRLFRHTSFLWRIRGEDAKEAKYLERLSKKKVEESRISDEKAFVIEFNYFTRRLKIVLLGASSPSIATKNQRSNGY